MDSAHIMPKPDYIFDLERRQQVLEEEITRGLSLCSPDDPMVADLKRRMLHLKEEIEQFCNKAIADRRLHSKRKITCPLKMSQVQRRKCVKRHSSQYLAPAKIAESLSPRNKSSFAQMMGFGMRFASLIPHSLSMCATSDRGRDRKIKPRQVTQLAPPPSAFAPSRRTL